MPQGKHVQADLEVMVELVIKERRIALPMSRLYWYARYFNIKTTRANLGRVCRDMVKAGKLAVVLDGKLKYYKNRRS